MGGAGAGRGPVHGVVLPDVARSPRAAGVAAGRQPPIPELLQHAEDMHEWIAANLRRAGARTRPAASSPCPGWRAGAGWSP
jgi:hypothetical protein